MQNEFFGEFNFIDNKSNYTLMFLSVNMKNTNDIMNHYSDKVNYSFLLTEKTNTKFVFSKFANALLNYTKSITNSDYYIFSCDHGFLNLDFFNNEIEFRNDKVYVPIGNYNKFNVSKGYIKYLINGIKLKEPLFDLKRILMLPSIKYRVQTYHYLDKKFYYNVMPISIFTKDYLNCGKFIFYEGFINGYEDLFMSVVIQNDIECIAYDFTHTPVYSFGKLKHSKNNNYGTDEELINNMKLFNKFFIMKTMLE